MSCNRLVIVLSVFLLALAVVEGFSSHSSSYRRKNGRRLPLAASSSSDGEASSSTSIPTTAVNGEDNSNEIDDIDFEAGFQARLEKEGGVTGLKAKAAMRSVDSMKNDVKDKLPLPKGYEWQSAVVFVAVLVLVALGSAIASPEPFERATTGEQLYFGVRNW